MQENDVIRAWKDEEYRSRLTEGEARSLPQNPAGLMELTDEDLLMTSGGTNSYVTITVQSWISTCLGSHCRPLGE